MNQYQQYLENKTQLGGNYGFDPVHMPDFLFDFQKHLVEWSLRKGRSAIFADCGLGKTPMQLVWADNVARKTNKNVLILTPLAVSSQTIMEANKFHIDANKSSDGSAHKITITNYEKLHLFDPKDFIGVVCDESSILKSFDGTRKQEITQFMRKMPYRLLCTATAAPNDYTELGTSSEALGYLGYMDMLNKYFKNDQNNSATRRSFGKVQKWRFKGHSQVPFWKWVSSWAKAVRKPSDIGFSDEGFDLPGLIEVNNKIETNKPPDGMLFSIPAIGLAEQRDERRRTLEDRCIKVSEIVNTDTPSLVWCNTNDEGDMLEEMIPDSVQVAGRHSNEVKEDRLIGFANGDFRVLITKPKIGAWGMNYQHCSHVVFFPTNSYEQYYQGVRRCHRFGQKNEVVVDLVTTEGDEFLFKNLKYKSNQADKMFESLVQHMNGEQLKEKQIFTKKQTNPLWLQIN